jgi:hypothetical protein
MALDINARSRVAKHVSLPFTIIFVLVVGTRGNVLGGGGGGPWRKTTASFDAPRWCNNNNNNGSWSATTRVNGMPCPPPERRTPSSGGAARSQTTTRPCYFDDQRLCKGRTDHELDEKQACLSKSKRIGARRTHVTMMPSYCGDGRGVGDGSRRRFTQAG